MPSLNLDYHYGTEAEQYSFYRTPKLLFYDTLFADVSLEAKVLYGMMIDRMSLSIQNHWADERGRIYIYFTMEDACKLLNVGRTKMVRIMAELDDQKGIGLIERRKQGQGKPTIIYVKNFTSVTQTSPKSPKQKHSFIKESELPEDHFQTVQSSSFNHSVCSQNETQDVHTRNSNNTDLNKTDLNDTESIYPSLSLSPALSFSFGENDGEMDGWNITHEVTCALYEQGGIPYAYIQDEVRMTEAIHLLTDYDTHCQNAMLAGGDSFRHSAFKLFNQALIEMLTCTRAMELRGSHVTNVKVYDKLIPYLNFDGSAPILFELPEIAISDYIQACAEREIKHHLAYMKSCIWYAMQVGDIGIQAQVHRDCSYFTRN